MFSYMFGHEAHHRGQAIMLARQLGYRIPDKAAYGIWRWEKLGRSVGLRRARNEAKAIHRSLQNSRCP